MPFSLGGASPSSTTAAAPTPAAGGFSFGGTPAAPVAAPSTTGGFSFGSGIGAPAAPAPAAGGGFSFTNSSGGTSSTSTGTSLFGPSPASTGTSTFTTGAFQQQQPQQQFQSQPLQQQQQPQHAMTSNTPFKALPPNAQKIIDDIFNLMHQHEQTMSSVSTMQPSSLQHAQSQIDGADVAAGTTSFEQQQQQQKQDDGGKTPLANRISSLLHEMKHIQQNLEQFNDQSNDIFQKSCGTLEATYKAGVYPLQSTAARMGITHEHLPEIQNLYHLSHSASDVARRLNVALLDGAGHVDYVEGMPSVYLWGAMEELNEKILDLGRRIAKVNQVVQGRVTGRMLLAQSQQNQLMMGMGGFGESEHGGAGPGDVLEDLGLAMNQKANALMKVAASVAKIQEEMIYLRSGYKEKMLRDKFHSRGGVSVEGVSAGMGSSFYSHGNGNGSARSLDPFTEADEREREYERRLEMEAQKRAIEAAASITTGQQVHQQATPASATAAPPSNLFSSTPAPGGGLFGSTTPTPAPSGGLFGSTTPAPAPGGGLFGTTPAAPAPSGGLFGSTTPAPSNGNGFGSTFTSTPTPAPSVGGGLFGSTPAPAFGTTAPVAPAPASGLFGANTATPASTFSSAPAPSGGFSFSSTSTTTSTSRSRRKQSGRKR
mmetsp:Transcript_11209/g.16960  ORF Transcript_11209/g.16960 Transcript_11209/m.16960 type:complete len:654 (-) Transcript_11209:1786-3747(-)